MGARRPPGPRLRVQAPEHPFHVVLVEPEIPPNTGNIARLCAAVQAPLHLVGQLGFRIDEHAVRRAGVDYWHLVDVTHHATLDACEADIDKRRVGGRENTTWLFSGRASRSFTDVTFAAGDALMFGCESVGLPEALLTAREERVVGIPTSGEVRSLNLANSVAIALYGALAQIGALSDAGLR